MEKQSNKEKLSGQTLYKLAHASETAENVCLALGTRERVRDFSNINSLKYELRRKGLKIVENDYMKMWKDWQSAGLGAIEFGRGKKQTKFIHFYNMRAIAAAALEGKDVEVESRKKEERMTSSFNRATQLESIVKSISEKTIVSPKMNAPVVAQTMPNVVNRIIVSLRPNVVVDLSLPQDITASEIDRIREALGRVYPAGASKTA